MIPSSNPKIAVPPSAVCRVRATAYRFQASRFFHHTGRIVHEFLSSWAKSSCRSPCGPILNFQPRFFIEFQLVKGSTSRQNSTKFHCSNHFVKLAAVVYPCSNEKRKLWTTEFFVFTLISSYRYVPLTFLWKKVVDVDWRSLHDKRSANACGCRASIVSYTISFYSVQYTFKSSAYAFSTSYQDLASVS